MRFALYVLSALSAAVAGAQANGDPPDYGKKPHYPQKHDCHDDHDDCHKEHDKYHDHHHRGYGHAKVVNFCPYDVYLWSVAWDTNGPYKIGCRQEYVEKYLKGGVALEIVKDKHHWYHDDGKLILYYKKHHGKVHYDLYDKHGHPFEGHKVVLKPEEDYCPAEYWDDGCDISDGGKKTCDDFADLVLYLCKEREHEYRKPPYHEPPKYGPPKYQPPSYPDPPKYPQPPKYPDPPQYPGYPPVVPPPSYPPVNPPPSYPPYVSPPVVRPPRRRHVNARSAEGDEEEAGHTRQWENDKPAWDTDAKCTACGEREAGVVVDIPADGPVKV